MTERARRDSGWSVASICACSALGSSSLPLNKGCLIDRADTLPALAVFRFEFTFGIPPEAPAREVSTSGRVLSNVYASLGSAGGLLKAAKLEDKKEAFIVHRDAAFGDDPSGKRPPLARVRLRPAST
jgi:hypothetical protein